MGFKGYSNKTVLYCVIAFGLYFIAIVSSNIVVAFIIAGAFVSAIEFGRNASVDSYKATVEIKT